MLESLKRDAITELVGVLSGFWSSIEEQVRLAALAGHDFSAAQEDRVAVIALSHRALELATRYREAIEDAFERWLEPREEHDRVQSLELMSEGELEIHLAGQQITELLEHQFLHPLAQLDERLEALAASLGIEGRPQNPLRPDVAVSAFVNLFQADDLTPGLRMMVFHQFDKRLPKVLGEVYAKANATLQTAAFGSGQRAAPARRGGSQPGGARPPERAGRADAPAEGWVPEGGVVEHAAGEAREQGTMSADFGGGGGGGSGGSGGGRGGTAAGPRPGMDGQPLRYRDIVREQLRAWREHGGLHAVPAEGADSVAAEVGALADAASEAVGQVLGTEDMLNIASLLQGDDPSPYTRALAGEDQRALAEVIRAEILGGVRQLGFDPEKTRFSADEEDAIDLVGILFQSLFTANDLLQRSRSLYGKLVVPYVKVALTDDSLFNRRSHPARQLLDALTEACDGNTGQTAQDQETLDKAEHAVDRVVEEYQEDQAVFELAAAELRDQLDQQRKRSDIAEKRAAEAIHGRERLQMARRNAESLVASRMADRALTAPVGHFLDQHWRHYLTQTWLRDGPESERHHAAIGLGDAMVQVDADAAQVRGAAVADQLLALQVPLGECYSSCGLDATAARDAMARIISALAMPDTPRAVRTPTGGEIDEDDGDEAMLPLRLAGGTDEVACDPAIAARMRRLRVGQGLRMIDRGGRETAARIAWISPLTSRFLIVNRRGVRKMVVSPEELALLVASGRVVVRSVDAPFDEAMKQLWQRLNQAHAPTQKAANAG
ncbi:DUF1631 family protein [Luteimonas sp. SJ-92]|uniref:DUF1631 family protein n=1 Tax=Luteimonas salinisoli TaxID=2752307 RepID=A0A853JCW7_9GAMM|nr:DUF1631 family protein [Luteimonas salinisoli]